MRILAVAQLTLVELWRQRTQWGFILLALLLALPAVLKFDGMRINGQVPEGLNLAEPFLAFAQFVAIFLAISASSGLVAHDLDRGTGLILLSKPLRRDQILLGKLLGAAAFMALAWIAWGAIAASAFALRLGAEVFLPTFCGFAASMVASWLVVAFCLFLSCWLPSNAVMGLAVIGWIVATTAPKIADLVSSAGYPTMGRVLTAIGEILPIERLSEAAKGLVGGNTPDAKILASAAFIAVWWLVAAIVFYRRDLAAPN